MNALEENKGIVPEIIMPGDVIEIISPDRILESDCIIFDLDGTLCDTIGDIEKCFFEAFSQCGLPRPDLSGLQIGPPLRQMTEKLFRDQADSATINRVIEEFRQCYNASDFNASPLYPGAMELLERLRTAEKPMAIATLKREKPTLRLLQKHGIVSMFFSILCCDSAERMWTKREMLESILSTSGKRPEHCLFFGDSVSDIVAGKSLGIPSIGVLYGYGDQDEILKAFPDYLCHHLCFSH